MWRDKEKPNKPRTNLEYVVRDIIKLIVEPWRKPTQFFIDHDRKILYISNPKIASSSIKQTFRDPSTEPSADLHKELTTKHFSRSAAGTDDYFAFTFVRNPFDRVVSCYEHKFANDQFALRRRFLKTKFDTDESFSSFVHKIAVIPDCISDIHFRSQSYVLHRKTVPTIDVIGHFESLTEDWQKVQDETDLLDLPHVHKRPKTDWRTYYTPELARIVYTRYQEDFTELGYETALDELLEFLRNQN